MYSRWDLQRPEAEIHFRKFMSKNQLTKGLQGEERDDAEYYWSIDGAMHSKPSSERYPIYRTNLPRQVKQGNASDF